MLKFGGSPCLLSGRNLSGRRDTARSVEARVAVNLPDPGRAQESEQYVGGGHARNLKPRRAAEEAAGREPNARDASPGRDAKPTLSQTWAVDEPAPAICVQSVDAHMSCSSHSDAQLAAFFIDPRAK